MTKIAPAHSEYSMSGAHRWIACPASISLSRGLSSPDTEASIEGTKTHTCFERLINSRLNGGRYAEMEQLRKEGHEWSRVLRAEKAYDQVIELWQKYPGAELHAETRVDTSHFTMPGNFGTVDVTISELFGKLVIADYKNGVMPVRAEENPQCIGYALGAAKVNDYNYDSVDIGIIQPNSRTKSRTFDLWTVSMNELRRKWIPIFKKAVKATLEPKPKIAEGEWCFFCPAKVKCPAKRGKDLERAKQAFAELDEPMW
jgi:hypothetical protein